MALRFWLGGEEVRGAYSIGAMTDPAWQGRRLFFRVGTRLYERIERESFAFVAGFSNRNSHRLMTGPLGRTAIRPFPLAIRPLRVAGLLRALAARALGRAMTSGQAHGVRPMSIPTGPVTIREIEPDETALDELWLRARVEVGVGAVRDRAYAVWRYGSPALDTGWLADRGTTEAEPPVPDGRVRADSCSIWVPPEKADRLLRALINAIDDGALLMACFGRRGAARRVSRSRGYWGVPGAASATCSLQRSR